MNSNISEANNDNFVDLVVKGSDTIPVVVDFGLHGVPLVNN